MFRKLFFLFRFDLMMGDVVATTYTQTSLRGGHHWNKKVAVGLEEEVLVSVAMCLASR